METFINTLSINDLMFSMLWLDAVKLNSTWLSCQFCRGAVETWLKESFFLTIFFELIFFFFSSVRRAESEKVRILEKQELNRLNSTRLWDFLPEVNKLHKKQCRLRGSKAFPLIRLPTIYTTVANTHQPYTLVWRDKLFTDLCSVFNTLDKTSVLPNKTGLHRVDHFNGEHFKVMRARNVEKYCFIDGHGSFSPHLLSFSTSIPIGWTYGASHPFFKQELDHGNLLQWKMRVAI